MRLLMCMVVLLGAGEAVMADVVERRGAEPQLVGQITRIDEAGVAIRTESGAVPVVSWDRVRSIQADQGRERVAQFAELATAAWRARTRLERGDAALAEPLFAKLFDQTIGQTSETALVIAEGLLRCRLDQGRNAQAVVPWLEVARIRRAGINTQSYRLLPEVVDTGSHTWLCPRLPPIWIHGNDLDKLSQQLDRYKADDPVVAWLAAAYRFAAQVQTAVANISPIGAGPKDPAVEAIRPLLDLASHDAVRRNQARSEGRAMLEEAPGWMAAWIRAAIGRSLLLEDDTAARQRGLVELVYLPAVYGAEQRYLSAWSMVQLIEQCEQFGDTPAAEHFRNELRSQFPQLAATVGISPQPGPAGDANAGQNAATAPQRTP